MYLKMSKVEKTREETTMLSNMPRVSLKSNFSINAILPEIMDRETPPPERSPASPMSDCEDASTDGDVIVDYDSDNEGEFTFKQICVCASRKKCENR